MAKWSLPVFPIQVGIQFLLEVNENKSVKFSRRLEWTFHWWGTPQGSITTHPLHLNQNKFTRRQDADLSHLSS